MCEFHDCNCNGLGDIWWTDKCMYFSRPSIDRCGVSPGNGPRKGGGGGVEGSENVNPIIF